MKKLYTLFAFVATALLQAQVPNHDFEAAFGYGSENVSDWGQFFVFQLSYNPDTGEFEGDDITFGEATLGLFCSSVADPHGGERAMFIRNAFNNTTNEVIPGKVDLFNSEISEQPSGWNTGIPVEPGANFEFFSFWYKFHPIGNDVAEAVLSLRNASGETIGTAKIQMTSETSAYTYAAVPITWTSVDIPTFLTITFNMQAEDSQATFGSYLLIDDVAVSESMLQSTNFTTSQLSIFPTVANSELNLVADIAGNYEISLIGIDGKQLSSKSQFLNSGQAATINVSSLSSGIYLIRAQHENSVFTKKFIKK